MEASPLIMCGSRKYPYSPHRRDWKFRGGGGGVGGGGGGGSQRPKNLKECMKLNWNFWRGWGGQRANPFRGGVWIFSGTKQFLSCVQ